MRYISVSIFFASLGIVCLACGGVEQPSLDSSPTAALEVVATGTQSDPAPSSANHSVSLPMTLVVTGETRGQLALVEATLRVSSKLEAPILLTIRLPAGAELVSGASIEELGRVEPNTVIRRTFEISGLAGPAVFMASSQGLAMGATAHAVWPQPVPAHVPEVRMEPIPPVELNGIRVDKAVPLR